MTAAFADPAARTGTGAAPSAPDPVDWALAERIARRVAGREPLADSYLARSLADDFALATRIAEEHVAAHTGLLAPDSARAAVVDRAGWVRANVASMRRLLAPLTERVGERLARSPIAPLGRGVAAAEMGFLLGYVAQRVLGQYDLLVPEGDDGAAGDAVYYVGGNILALEKRYAFRPRDFRLWVALHEVTHRAQFTGVPWMRDHFLSLVTEAMRLADPDPKRLGGVAARLASDLRNRRNPLDDGLVGLFAGPEQRAVLEQIQALMSLLEGHGNAVMNRLGADLVDGQARMARVLQARRATTGATAVLHKLMGLDLKLRQYEVGEAFVTAVEREGGPRALDAAWRAPAMLPTLAELSAPSDWLGRLEATPA